MSLGGALLGGSESPRWVGRGWMVALHSLTHFSACGGSARSAVDLVVSEVEAPLDRDLYQADKVGERERPKVFLARRQ